MAAKDKETSGSTTRGGSRSKRPARTIDLEAEEVEIDAKDASEKAGRDAAANEAPADAAETEDAAKAADSTEQRSEAAEPAEDEQPGGPLPPPQRTRPVEVRAFVTHLAAGLVGGLIGVIGAGIGLDKLPFMSFTGDADGEKTAQIEERLDEITSRQSQLSKQLEVFPKPDALTTLESRLSKIESAPAPTAEPPSGIVERLAKLEDTLKTLQNAASSAGATGLEQSAALTAKIDTVSAELEKQATTLKQDIAETRKQLQARPAAESSVSDGSVEALDTRLKTLEEKLAASGDRPAAAVPAPDTASVATALAFESLRHAAERGEPFAAQLETLEKAAGADLDAASLSAFAAKGVPTKAALLSSLPTALREAREAALKTDDETFLDRLASNARSVVRVRRIGPVEGENAAAVLSRIEARIKVADLAGAVSEANGLKGPARDALNPWLASAEQRFALEDALAAAETRLLASVGAGAQPQR
jgi:hypothetical protein